MARYFFNVRGGVDTFDDIGCELDGERAVHEHMIVKATKLAFASKDICRSDRVIEIEALDFKGKIVATLTVDKKEPNGTKELG